MISVPGNNDLRKNENAGSPERTGLRFRSLLADGALVLCALLWGLGFVAMKEALGAWPAFSILFFRFGIAALLTGIVFHRRILRARRRDLVGGAVIGCFLFLAMGIQTLGLAFTTAGKQAFLTAVYVIVVPLLLWVRQRIFPGWTTMFSAAVCFTGMGLLTSDATGPLNVGDVLTIVAAVFFAAQIIAIGDRAAGGDPLVLSFAQFSVAALFSLVVALWRGNPIVFHGTRGVPEILFSAFFCTFFCFMTQTVAQKYTTPTHASILLGLESVFGVLSGIVLLGETLTLRMGIGCALIFGAVLVVELAPNLLRPTPIHSSSRRPDPEAVHGSDLPG
jgi:drug/metabolite transporter (DMT)-like permease